MGIFQEYINSKGKTVEKAPVDIKGGKPDPATPPQSPPKQTNPYIAKGGKKTKGGEKGFADMGDKILKYQPKVGCTMEQIKLSKRVVRNLESNPLFAEQLVQEFKKSGTLSTILAEMLQHKAAYKCISEVMSHQKYGPVVCNKLVRAMNEQTAPGFSKDSSGLEDDTDVLQDDETDSLQDSDEFSGEDMDDDESSDEDLDDEDIMLKDDPEEEEEELEKDMENPEGMGDEDNMEEMPLDAPMGSPGQPGMPAMSGQMPDQPMPGAEMPQGMPPAMQNFRQAMMRRW